jgi:hypothetical protein
MKAKRRRVKMEIEMDIPGKNETKYTKLVGEMLEAFENADPANKKEEFADCFKLWVLGAVLSLVRFWIRVREKISLRFF